MSDDHVETRLLVPADIAAQVEIARSRDGKPLNDYWVETMDRRLNGVLAAYRKEKRDEQG
ncbi:hypothetical protein GKE73_16350 [Paludibacterium sp. dN 18-1]|uniref:Uncharacterized protein n=1 Tax=Paludibacterium denitrificans TaxID=2675226 RepID=A0A844GGJ2_9NEIS|nr:hypothetical protein [Paludibacterium denitrificans]